MVCLWALQAIGCEYLWAPLCCAVCAQATSHMIDSLGTLRNNFIVGQVTPDMLNAMPYGTYILFGLLTYLGAAFIWFFVPETKRLTLEEMVRHLLLLCIPLARNCFISGLTDCWLAHAHRMSFSDLRAPHRPTSSAWRRSTMRLA